MIALAGDSQPDSPRITARGRKNYDRYARHDIRAGTFDTFAQAGPTGCDEFSWKPYGSGIDFDYDGYTDIAWGRQQTVYRDNERVFVDEAGEEWPESVVTLVEAEEES